jgi:hypothetical protein
MFALLKGFKPKLLLDEHYWTCSTGYTPVARPEKHNFQKNRRAKALGAKNAGVYSIQNKMESEHEDEVNKTAGSGNNGTLFLRGHQTRQAASAGDFGDSGG